MSKQPSNNMINLIGHNRKIQHSFGFDDSVKEFNVELFAGAGGFGAGAAMAGMNFDIAINHSPVAMACHQANFPHATQMINDVFEYHPLTVLMSQGASLDLIDAVRNYRSVPLSRYLVGHLHLSPDCFPAGTLVLTDKGYFPIEEVVVGDKVLSHTLQWKKVTGTMKSEKSTMTIRGYGHDGIAVSGEHPFYVRKRKDKWNNGKRQYDRILTDLEWIKAKDITEKEMYWAAPKIFPSLDIPEIKEKILPIDERLLWLAGRYVGDGWSRVGNKFELVITCGKHEIEDLREKLNMWPRKGTRCCYDEISWLERHTATAYQFATFCKGLVIWLREQFGHLAHGKRIPAWLLGADKNLKQAFLDGYLSADGHRRLIHGTPTYYCDTTSKQLAFGLQALVHTMGGTPSVKRRQNSNHIQGRAVNSRIIYSVKWREYIINKHKQTFSEPGYEWRQIKEVVKNEGLSAVYNLSVEDDESYIVENIIVHNCTFHSKAKGKKKVLKRHTVCGDHCDVDQTTLSQETAERIRGLAWCGIGWAAVARPKRITLENVSEFRLWGPTMVDEDGDIVPDPSHEAETFNAFVGVLSTGIDAEVSINIPKIIRFVNSNKLPKRKPKALKKGEWEATKIWFKAVEKQMVSKERPLSPWHCWKQENPALAEMRRFLKPFLGEDYNEQNLIDGLGYDVEFKELVASDYGAPTSRKRLFMIARCDGVAIKWPTITHGDPESDEVKSGKLLPWRTAGECIDWSVIAPSIFDTKEEVKEAFGLSVRRPLVDNSMVRIARGIIKFVIGTNKPYIVKINHSNDTFHGQSIEEPLQANGYGIAAPYITGIGSFSWERHALTAAYVVNAKGTDPKSMPIGNDAGYPMTTVTAHDTHGIVMAHLMREFGQSIGSSIHNPVPTITAGGGGKTSLVAAHCIKMKGDNLGYGCNEPVQTITAGGMSHGLVASHLFKYYGADEHGQNINEPIHTITTKERFGLITENLMQSPLTEEQRYKAWQIARMLEVYADVPVPMLGGIPLPRRSMVRTATGHIIADIGMRMLIERELFTAQGFLKTFIYDPEVEEYGGASSKPKRRKITKTEAVRLVGNSVPPHFAMAIIEALDEAEAEHSILMAA
jgi:DNA (cytosine-5)-methyltransferase 1